MSKKIEALFKSGSKSDCPSRLELKIADLLKHGTIIASVVIGLGLLLKAIHWDYSIMISETVVKTGIALFILLPVLRVILMLAMFVRERDRHFVGIAAVVLLFILTSFVLSIAMPKVLPG